MELRCYRISPIDFNWVLAPKISSLAEKLKGAVETLDLEVGCDELFKNLEAIDDVRSIMAVYDGYISALEHAKRAGWEGDHAEPPRYFVIPAETDFYFGFIFKQSNSGVTFVISPISLPHLDPLSI